MQLRDGGDTAAEVGSIVGVSGAVLRCGAVAGAIGERGSQNVLSKKIGARYTLSKAAVNNNRMAKKHIAVIIAHVK